MQAKMQKKIEEVIRTYSLPPGYYLVMTRKISRLSLDNLHYRDDETAVFFNDELLGIAFCYRDVSHIRMTNILTRIEQLQWLNEIAKYYESTDWLVVKVASKFSPHSHYRLEG